MNRLGIMIDVSHPSKESMMQTLQLTKAPIIASHSAVRKLCDNSRNMDDEQLLALKKNGGVIQIVAFNTYVKTPPPDSSGARGRARRPPQGVQPASRYAARRPGWTWPRRARSGRRHRGWPRRQGRTRRSDRGSACGAARRVDEVNAQFPPPPRATVKDFVDHIDYAVKLIGIDHVGISSDFDGGGGVDGWNGADETFNVTLELVRRGYTEAANRQDLERQPAPRDGRSAEGRRQVTARQSRVEPGTFAGAARICLQCSQMTEIYLGELEQIVLLAVLRVGDDAYAIPILEEIAAQTGRKVSRGALYTALERLETKGCLRSRLGEPLAERGGRARRYFTVTAAARRSLQANRGRRCSGSGGGSTPCSRTDMRQPPWLAERILGLAIRNPNERDMVLGDLHEEWLAGSHPGERRGLWYCRQALGLAAAIDHSPDGAPRAASPGQETR